MTSREKSPDKWQLSQWTKGVPYGSAPLLLEEHIVSIRQYLCDRISRKTGRRDLLLFDLLLNTGCYVGELYNLKNSDIAFGLESPDAIVARDRIIFRNSPVSKSRNDRIVPTTPALRKSIEENSEIAETWVCWSQLRENDSRMDKIHLTYLIHSWGKACGVKIRAHSFRKTFMKHLTKNCTDIKTLLQLSGHKSAQSLMQYFMSKPADTGEKPLILFDRIYANPVIEVKKVS